MILPTPNSLLIFVLMALLPMATRGQNWVRGATAVDGKEALNITVRVPPETKPNDLMVLYLMRTGGTLPVELIDDLAGWDKKVAGVFVPKIPENRNQTSDECPGFVRDGICRPNLDLGQVVFTKVATRNEPSSYFIPVSLSDGKEKSVWAIMVSIKRNAVDQEDPIRGIPTWEYDDNDFKSVFPSVDDGKKFPAPRNTKLVTKVVGKDHSGFVYAKALSEDGESGVIKTGTGEHTFKKQPKEENKRLKPRKDRFKNLDIMVSLLLKVDPSRV